MVGGWCGYVGYMPVGQVHSLREGHALFFGKTEFRRQIISCLDIMEHIIFLFLHYTAVVHIVHLFGILALA